MNSYTLCYKPVNVINMLRSNALRMYPNHLLVYIDLIEITPTAEIVILIVYEQSTFLNIILCAHSLRM